MPPKGNPNAKKVKIDVYMDDLEKSIAKLQRQLKDAKEINSITAGDSLSDAMNQEDEFEKSLMEKYPSLFHKNEDGNTKYAECGIGCPKAWQQIVDDLCGSIVSYQQYRHVSIPNPNKKIRIWFDDKIVSPIWWNLNKLVNELLDPYKPYRPKDKKVGWWVIPPEVSALVKTTSRYKFREWFKTINFGKFPITDKYIKKEIPDVKIAQVKTKFGGLRFYIDGGDSQVYGMIQFAEYLCYKTK